MQRIGLIILTFALCLAISVHAQEKKGSETEYKGVGFNAGYIYQHASYFEASALFYHGSTTFNTTLGFSGITTGCEFRFNDHFLMGPKVAIFITGWVLSGRFSAVYLTDFKQGSLHISPEAGVTLGGWIYLMAGVNWTVINKQFLNTTGFKCSLGFNLYEMHTWGK